MATAETMIATIAHFLPPGIPASPGGPGGPGGPIAPTEAAAGAAIVLVGRTIAVGIIGTVGVGAPPMKKPVSGGEPPMDIPVFGGGTKVEAPGNGV